MQEGKLNQSLYIQHSIFHFKIITFILTVFSLRFYPHLCQKIPIIPTKMKDFFWFPSDNIRAKNYFCLRRVFIMKKSGFIAMVATMMLALGGCGTSANNLGGATDGYGYDNNSYGYNGYDGTGTGYYDSKTGYNAGTYTCSILGWLRHQ